MIISPYLEAYSKLCQTSLQNAPPQISDRVLYTPLHIWKCADQKKEREKTRDKKKCKEKQQRHKKNKEKKKEIKRKKKDK